MFRPFTFLPAIILACFLLSSVEYAVGQFSPTVWFGETGDWFTAENWDNGLPDAQKAPIVNSGEVRFSSDVIASQPTIVDYQAANTYATVRGTANFTSIGDTTIGIVSGIGTSTVRQGQGKLTISGGDFTSLLLTDPEFPFDNSADVRIGTASGTGKDSHFTGSGVVEIIGGTLSSEGSITIGQVRGTGTGTHITGNGGVEITDGSLLSEGTVEIGEAGGTGSGGTRTAIGELTILDGILQSTDRLSIGVANGSGSTDIFANGVVEITNGSLLSEEIVDIGQAGGTGSGGTQTGIGELTILDGMLQATDILSVGVANGTGSTKGYANGTVTIHGGDLVVEKAGSSRGKSFGQLLVGFGGGTGDFDSDVTGHVTVVEGDITAGRVSIGVATGISGSSSRADGRLQLSGGNLVASRITVGIVSGNGITATGVLEIEAGTISANHLTVGEGGSVVLVIGSPQLGEFEAAMSLPISGSELPIAQLDIGSARIDGTVEVRFADDFEPKPNDVFDLIVADSLSGNFDLQITGLSQEQLTNLEITQTDQLLRLAFTVPEPSSFVIALVLTAALAVACHRS